MYEVRFYRDWVAKSGLVTFQAVIRESDLLIRAHRNLTHQAIALLEQCRSEIESEIQRRPEFAESLYPLPMPTSAGPVIRAMTESSRRFDVGPMAAVAGAVAQYVGEGLLRWSPEIIVENGGDLYIKADRPVDLGLYAGEESPFSGEIKLRVTPGANGMGVCTSSGTVGHSLSFGRADAVVAVADNAALADAAATAIGNQVKSAEDVEGVLNRQKESAILKGLVIVVGKRMGAYGDIEFER